MRFTLSWLREHLDFSMAVESVVDRLTSLGLEVEESRPVLPAGFRIAEVLEVKAHPRAESLYLCRVRYDEQAAPVEVVCGAGNVRRGMRAVFAPIGSVIPATHVVLRKAKIQGEDSCGMLLSEYELCLSSEHEEIVELDPSAPIGADFAEYAALDDWLIEVAVTPNRADCLGVRGIARDLAAAEVGRLKPLSIPAIEERFAPPIVWRIDLPDSRHCPYVAGRYFRNLKNGAAPHFVRKRLHAIGMRPVSALVDMTNYVTLDLGRPLHVFDGAHIRGEHMTVRKARADERLAALDNKDYALSPQMTVIADEQGVQGLAGVMGGRNSGCSEQTESAFLECALFDSADIAATGRALNLHSEARFRFERGVDSGFARAACDIASAYILRWCGGEASHLSEAGTPPDESRRIMLRVSKIETYGGVKIPTATARSILEGLGFACSEDSSKPCLSASVPSWRQDVEEEACLIEEVLRVYGFDNIPLTPFVRTEVLGQKVLDQRQRRSALVRKQLAIGGLDEIVTWSFVDSGNCGLFSFSESLRLQNPISAQMDVMRPTLLLGLLQVAAANMARGERSQSLFEVGPLFSAPAQGSDKATVAHGIEQTQVAAGLRVGLAHERHWAESSRGFDSFDCKADLLSVFSACGLESERLESRAAVLSGYHPSRAGEFVLGKSVIGHFGELHPELCEKFGLRARACAFEGFLDRIPSARRRIAAKGFHKQRLQSVHRDFAFWLPEAISAAEVKSAVLRTARNTIRRVRVFDEYRDPKRNERSLAFEVEILPHKERAYSDSELRLLSEKIVACVVALGGLVREGGS